MRYLIIGYGSMGRKHTANLQQLCPDAEIYLYDPVLFPERKLIPSDAAIIASPAQQHREHILWCCQQRMPFLVEKPLGMTQIPSVIPPACAVGFNYRFHAQWHDIATLAKTEKLYFRAYESFFARYGPTVGWTSTSHAIDMALILLGAADPDGVHLWSDGIRLQGTIMHRHGISRYDYHCDTGKKDVTINNGRTRLVIRRDPQAYHHEISAWLTWLHTGVRDPRLASIADGLAVENCLQRCVNDAY